MIRGHVIRYGDNIDTDVILPGRYLTRFDLEHLARHCMEDLDPDFLNKKRPGDIIVAGNNFGCGSSRELAPVAIKAADISCIVARSFARIFYRNAVNVGLMIFECPEAADALQEGDEIEVDPEQCLIRNVRERESYKAAPFPALVREIIDGGGLIDFVRRRLKERG